MLDRFEKSISNKKCCFKQLLLLISAFLLFFMHSTALYGNVVVKEPVVAYEAGIDQLVYKSFVVSKEIGKGFFIFKKYLSSRKAKFNPERSQYVEYFISNGQQQIPLTKLPKDHNVIVKEEYDGRYSIYFNVGGESFEHYRYSASTHTLKKESEDLNGKNVGVPAGFGYSDKGSVSVSLDDESVLEYKFGKTSASGEPKKGKILFQAPKSVLEIIGIYEAESKHYAFGIGYKVVEPDVPFIWLIAFNPELEKWKVDISRYDIGKSASVEVKRIPSFNDGLALHVQNRQARFEPLENLILDDKLKLLWKNQASKLEDDSLSVARVCRNNFAILKKEKTRKITDSVNLTVINSSGKNIYSTSHKVVDNGSLIDAMVQPGKKGLVTAFINFSKTENTRRNDGWYSWEGYKVIEFKLDCT